MNPSLSARFFNPKRLQSLFTLCYHVLWCPVGVPNGIRGLVGKNDWPRYVEEEPEIYSKAELKTFLSACDAQEKLWFEFFLMTGEREQEVMYTYWSDIKFADAIVRVTHKPDRGWTPKTYKEREIPIPAKLLKALKAWKASSDRTCNLVLPTTGSNPKLDFLDCCKGCDCCGNGLSRQQGRIVAVVSFAIRRLEPFYDYRSTPAHSAQVANVARNLCNQKPSGFRVKHALLEAITQPAGVRQLTIPPPSSIRQDEFD